MIDRYLGVKKIKNSEERKEAEDKLNENIREYEWVTKSKDIYADINAKLDAITNKYEDAEMSEEDRDKVAILHRKYLAIKNGTYLSMLRRNMASLLVSLEDDDARKENRPPINVLLGIMTGDEGVKAWCSKRWTFFLANLTGEIPGVVDMKLESMEEILDYIGTHCDLVLDPTVDLESKKEHEIVETALVPLNELPSSSLLERVSNNIVNQYLEEQAAKKDKDVVVRKQSLEDETIENPRDVKSSQIKDKSRNQNNRPSHGTPGSSDKEIE